MLLNHCPAVKSLFIHHIASGSMRLVPIRCKLWSCRYCKRLNLQKLLHRIREGKPTKFITLTCLRQSTETVAQCHDRHRIQIRRLVAKIRKHYGSFEACTVCEQTKAGNPHWHMVARCNYLPQRDLSNWWFKLTGSKVIDIRRIKNPRHAATYVAKYVGKSVGYLKPTWMKRVYQFTGKYAKVTHRGIPEGFVCSMSRNHPVGEAERLIPWYQASLKEGNHWLFFQSAQALMQESLWSWMTLQTRSPPCT